MSQEQIENTQEEISLKELILKIKEWFQFLLSKWKTILIAGILGGALGLTYSILKKPIYIAETTFVLEDSENGAGGLGSYAGLASVVGIDLNGSSGGLFQSDNIIQLYKSRKMIEETLLSKAIIDGKSEFLINRYIEFNELRKSWEKYPKLLKLNFDKTSSKFNRDQDSIVSQIVLDINKNYLEVKKPDKKLSVISVKVKSKDEAFSKAFADNIVETVNQFYITTKTKKSAENVAILERQTDSVRLVLNSSIGSVASAVDANPNINSVYQKLRVPSQRKQVDVQASGAIYQELVKNLELSRITLRKEKPLIQVIDEPIFPLEKERIGKAKGILFGGIIIGFFTCIFLLVKRLFKNILV